MKNQQITLLKEREVLRTLLLRSLPLGITPSERYNVEYEFRHELEGSLYSFDSHIFSLLEEILKNCSKRSIIIDAGAGNGQLLKYIRQLGFYNLIGIDISSKSIDLIEKFGINCFCGRIESSPVMYNSIDILFLSYFIDRDSDQARTFIHSINLLKRNGTLVIEGLFPCVLVDSNGVNYGPANVTRGKDALEDIFLAINFLEREGLKLTKMIRGNRKVFSLDGLEELSSDILIFKKIRKN